MRSTSMEKSCVLLASLALLVFAAGCRIHVDKDASGKEKNVRVDTPFGGVHVNTDQTTAADVGLPAYPGAQVSNDEKHKSADVHLGFGEWELRVKVVSYATADSQDKVAVFYKQALARYGDVITCQDHRPVGTPTQTSEGLTCADNHSDVNVDSNGHKYGYQPGHGGYELKAGSKRHQHIVGLESSAAGTRFALVALDLPSESGEAKSD